MQSIVSQSPRVPIVLMVPMLYQSPNTSFCEQKKSHFPYTMVQSKSCSSEKAQWGHRKGGQGWAGSTEALTLGMWCHNETSQGLGVSHSYGFTGCDPDAYLLGWLFCPILAVHHGDSMYLAPSTSLDYHCDLGLTFPALCMALGDCL